MIEKRVLSSDGKHELSGVVYVPSGAPKAIFQVVHGMAEHISRYEAFMQTMAEQGYVCFGYDHLGHGETALDESELGYIAPADGWNHLVKDVSLFASAVREEYGPSLPYYLLGHSMGSFIVRLVALQNQPDKLIIMGTGGPNPASGAGLAMIGMNRFFKGERHCPKSMAWMMFGSYNKRFKDEKDEFSWLSKDVTIRDEYRNDPKCGFLFSNSALKDLMYLLRNCNAPDWFQNFPSTLPTLLMSGEDDPVGDYTKGVRYVYDHLQAAGANVGLRLYPGCRHEILNDTCREQVIKDILEFFEK